MSDCALPVIQATTQQRGTNLTPQNIDEAIRFADLLSKSSIIPKEYQGNPGNILVAMQWGQELGLLPLQAMQSIAVINGRPAVFGDAMIALVKGSGLLEAMREDLGDDYATCHVKRRGEPEMYRTFSAEDARRAGLWGRQGPWQQYPQRMLQMRARAWVLRDAFPDVLRGVHVAEEAQDIPRERDITPYGTSEIQAPITRTEQVKRQLGRSSDVALETVLSSIAAANDDAALSTAGALAKRLPSSADRETARAAYKARRELLRASAAAGQQNLDNNSQDAITPATASIETNNQLAYTLTYDNVRNAIYNASTESELVLAVDGIQYVADAGQRDELQAIAREARAFVTCTKLRRIPELDGNPNLSSGA